MLFPPRPADSPTSSINSRTVSLISSESGSCSSIVSEGTPSAQCTRRAALSGESLVDKHDFFATTRPSRFLYCEHRSGWQYAWMRHRGVYYISVYLTLSDRIEEFQVKLDDLENTIRNMEGKFVVARDFNAKAFQWCEIR